MKTYCINDPKLKVHARGLCRKCFNYASLRVRNGVWTWAQLEALGKAKPEGKRGRKAPEWAQDV